MVVQAYHKKAERGWRSASLFCYGTMNRNAFLPITSSLRANPRHLAKDLCLGFVDAMLLRLLRGRRSRDDWRGSWSWLGRPRNGRSLRNGG
jgi:hypothetical protein